MTDQTPTAPLSVVILGCGRVGSTFARQLSQGGHAVSIIDLTGDAFRRLGPKFKGSRVVGTGLDQDTLKKAGIEKADVFVAVTHGDNTNSMAAQIARVVFSIPRVIARFNDPIRAQAYREMGLTTLCTTTLMTGLIRESVLSEGCIADPLWQETLENWDREYLEQAG